MSTEVKDELREIDAQVARLMSWRNVRDGYLFGNDDTWGGDNPLTPDRGIQDLPHFSSDIGAAMEMEERIKELGLQLEYARALCEQVGRPTLEPKYVELFDVLHASPLDRARAALAIAPK